MAPGSTSTGRALMRDPMSKLTDDLLVEIISRVPYKSTCCCKCVSTRWRDLIAHPDSRKKMPQTLVGFFNDTLIHSRSPKWVYCYTDVSEGVYPRFDQPFSFLMPECELIDMYDCCNGLLLLRGYNTPQRNPDYVVCNPVTEKRVTVPTSNRFGRVDIAHLGFDPAVSSHFHVFEFVRGHAWDVKSGGHKVGTHAVGIYSSKTGAWTYRFFGNNPIALFCPSRRSAFLNGVLYVSSYEGDFVIAVDVKGNCRVLRIPMPHSYGDVHDVYQSQGQLHLTYRSGSALSIWVLEDLSGDNWILKHEFSQLQLFGKDYSPFEYEAASIHPERSVIFIACRLENAQSPRTLMSYDMDSGERRFICHQLCDDTSSYLPFVPLFSELLPDGH